MRALPGIGLALALAACASFPEIDAANRNAGPAGPPPPLLPFAELEAATAGTSPDASPAEDLEGRAAALQARAAILRQSGDIDALRARLARLP
ncbi:MAG: hypothetical protein QNJ13_09045 [Paracoccaceae bacterium]|nr:hypothetical protein [Paracoccaceae bacterium]